MSFYGKPEKKTPHQDRTAQTQKNAQGYAAQDQIRFCPSAENRISRFLFPKKEGGFFFIVRMLKPGDDET